MYLFKDKVVVINGRAHKIGKCIADEFRKDGASICVIESIARVNSISPGWTNSDYTSYERPDATQQPVGRVGNPQDIAQLALFLCSNKADFITGENICISGGMTKQMICHGEHGWN